MKADTFFMSTKNRRKGGHKKHVHPTFNLEVISWKIEVFIMF